MFLSIYRDSIGTFLEKDLEVFKVFLDVTVGAHGSENKEEIVINWRLIISNLFI